VYLLSPIVLIAHVSHRASHVTSRSLVTARRVTPIVEYQRLLLEYRLAFVNYGQSLRLETKVVEMVVIYSTDVQNK
jgi:hypothetical protein